MVCTRMFVLLTWWFNSQVKPDVIAEICPFNDFCTSSRKFIMVSCSVSVSFDLRTCTYLNLFERHGSYAYKTITEIDLSSTRLPDMAF